MSENQVAVMSHGSEIPCLLIPLTDQTLLVPTVTVAEMAPVQPIAKVEGAPQWLYGMYRWRELEIPLIAYEVLNGGEPMPLNTSGRVAVFNNTGVSDSLHFIAIAAQGIPRMARVGEGDINENIEQARGAVDLMAVKVGMEEFVIPDVAALETAYLNLGLS